MCLFIFPIMSYILSRIVWLLFFWKLTEKIELQKVFKEKNKGRKSVSVCGSNDTKIIVRESIQYTTFSRRLSISPSFNISFPTFYLFCYFAIYNGDKVETNYLFLPHGHCSSHCYDRFWIKCHWIRFHIV